MPSPVWASGNETTDPLASAELLVAHVPLLLLMPLWAVYCVQQLPHGDVDMLTDPYVKQLALLPVQVMGNGVADGAKLSGKGTTDSKRAERSL